jgi:hypothetical protein
MKMKKMARLAGMLTLGRVVTIAMKLLIVAVTTLFVLAIAGGIGIIAKICIPYKTISALTAITVLASLVVLTL